MNDTATTEKSTKPRKFTRKATKKEKPVEAVEGFTSFTEAAEPTRKPRRKKTAAKAKTLTGKQLNREADKLLERVKAVREKAAKLTRFEALRSAKADHVLAASALIEIRKMLAKAEKDEAKALAKHNKARVAYGLEVL